MNTIEPLAISKPFDGTVSATPSAIAERDAALKASAGIVSVVTQDELELAVRALRDIGAMIKATEDTRKEIGRPVLALTKLINSTAEDFVAPLEKDKLRLTGMVNHFQRKQLEEQAAKDRAAQAEREKAQREAAEAQRRIEEQQREIERQTYLAAQAKTVKAREAAQLAQRKAEQEQLAAQLQQEEAAMDQQAAETQLAAPTNTPRGMVTRQRFDFEITDWRKAVVEIWAFWTWHKDGESAKFDRAGFLKALNSEEPSVYLPKDGDPFIVHPLAGIRVFVSVSTHVRS